jgi:hypothetical protein
MLEKANLYANELAYYEEKYEEFKKENPERLENVYKRLAFLYNKYENLAYYTELEELEAKH